MKLAGFYGSSYFYLYSWQNVFCGPMGFYIYTLNCCRRFYTNLIGVFVQVNTVHCSRSNFKKNVNELKYSSPINEISGVSNKAAISSRVCLLRLAATNITNMQQIG
jgi:hypothetical protein